jgi:uncharacterized LabA/DUF88 family protein
MKRVCAYIDGFNLYHAIDGLHDHRLKWLNLCSLIKVFIDPKMHELGDVYYFSAFADWLPDARTRHISYVKALESVGVIPVMGKFKLKDRSCRKCGVTWKGHEEKETDVNIALRLLDDAYQDKYDIAIIVSRDSDLAPALKIVKDRFPEKILKIVTPPGARHSKEMAQIVGEKHLASIKTIHLQHNQFPEIIVDADGKAITSRPEKYSHKGANLLALRKKSSNKKVL